MLELQLERASAKSPPFESWLNRHIASRGAELHTTGTLKLSVCVPVFNQPARYLEEMYRSYLMQTYSNKELVIVDDGSFSSETLEWLDRTNRQGLVTFLRHERNLGIKRRQPNLAACDDRRFHDLA